MKILAVVGVMLFLLAQPAVSQVPDDLLAAYGEPTVGLTTGPNTRLDIYDEIGIAFDLTAKRARDEVSVGVLYAFRPHTAKEIWEF